MSEFIGSRISLISKSDIRYVGTLHEINSETSTVALETVKSFGTEGRKNDPDEEIAGSDNIYEYIVFRGSDVKDLRIEEPPKENKPPPAPQVPNDPAILGSARPQGTNGQGSQMPPGGPRGGNFPPGPGFPPHQYRPYGGPPGGPGFGPPGGGFPPYGPPPGHFGGPPGWHGGPPPGAPGFPGGPGGPGHFNGPYPPQHQQNLSFGGPGPEQLTHQRQQPSQGPAKSQEPPKPPAQAERSTPTQKPDGSSQPPSAPAADRSNGGQAAQPQPGPPPPNASKPNPAAAMAPANNKPAAQKPNRIDPAVPLAASRGDKAGARPAQNARTFAATAATAEQAKQPQAASDAALQHQNATTQAATAAVAAAMAKLNNPASGQAPANVDNLTQKVNEMRMDEHSRTHDRGTMRGRGGRRGGRGAPRGIDVPESDFDFESANAKFDKSNLTKATSMASPGADGAGDAIESEEVVIPPAEPAYSKDSFFDSLSREDTEAGRRARGGREFRQEDRKMNMETFGMSSVDYGRGGFRGRGRGRGYGRGGYGRGRGRGRGAFGASESAAGF